MRLPLLGFAAAVGLAAAAYGAAPYAPTQTGRTVTIEMADNEFAPAAVRVQPGSTVSWRNTGRSPHTATADDGSWDSGEVYPGEEFRRTFDRPGAYRYFCVPHGFRRGRGMAGVILVGEAEDLSAPVPPAGITGPGGQGAAGPGATRAGPPRALRVPAQVPTIQAAVDAARPGDLILIAPGVYAEEVVVTAPGLTLRGEDRNRVILDGGFSRANGVKVLGADGVVIENMTARHYTVNGFYWTGVRGYRGSYLTAYNNGDYGIYAFDSVYGQFDHSYASGHPDSGFYIGQCKPCHALIADVLAEHNALGYSGTNAGGNLTITRSVWRYNLAGLVPNTLDSERLAPQDGTRIAGNQIYANHNERAPVKALQYPTFGNGVILAGGINNVVEGNLIWDHPNFGILVIANLDRSLWIPSGHRIRANTVWGSGRADLALAAPAGGGTCFDGNRFARSRPPVLQRLYGCGAPLTRVGGGDPGALVVMLRQYARAQSGRFTSPDWKTQPVPPPQPSMPDPLRPPVPSWPTAESTVPAAAFTGTPAGLPPDAAAFAAPVPTQAPAAAREYVRLAWYLLPFLLYDALIVAVGWDARRRRLGGLRTLGWTLTAVVLPYVGALLYLWRRRRKRGPREERNPRIL